MQAHIPHYANTEQTPAPSSGLQESWAIFGREKEAPSMKSNLERLFDHSWVTICKYEMLSFLLCLRDGSQTSRIHKKAPALGCLTVSLLHIYSGPLRFVPPLVTGSGTLQWLRRAWSRILCKLLNQSQQQMDGDATLSVWMEFICRVGSAARSNEAVPGFISGSWPQRV